MWITFDAYDGEAVHHNAISTRMICEVCTDRRVSHDRRTQFWNNAGR